MRISLFYEPLQFVFFTPFTHVLRFQGILTIFLSYDMIATIEENTKYFWQDFVYKQSKLKSKQVLYKLFSIIILQLFT